MHHDLYVLEASGDYLQFEFYSTGPKGRIKKKITFKPFDGNPDVFNLGFGDVDACGKVNDNVVSNNKDSPLVLATVALAVYEFCERRPDSWIYAIGTTASRTRLYRIGIANNLNEIRNGFLIFGFADDVWEPFEKNKNYKAFLVKRKGDKL